MSSLGPSPPPTFGREGVLQAFNLAWYTKRISLAAGHEVYYLLVPVDVHLKHTLFLGSTVISDSGRPVDVVNAFSSQLACLRDPSTPDGQVDSDEQALIEKLRAKAAQTGHALPLLVPTREKPVWSRATLTKMARLVLIRSAGLS